MSRLPVIALMSLLPACASSSGASKSSGPTACSTDSACSGGEVCGWDNAGTHGDCAARGICVMPYDRQPTMLCGCGGKSVDLVVDDPDAGVYYWSGVIVGEQGFPPCGDAAIAPSSNPPDASDAASQ